jgi:hypothetical protein
MKAVKALGAMAIAAAASRALGYLLMAADDYDFGGPFGPSGDPGQGRSVPSGTGTLGGQPVVGMAGRLSRLDRLTLLPVGGAWYLFGASTLTAALAAVAGVRGVLMLDLLAPPRGWEQDPPRRAYGVDADRTRVVPRPGGPLIPSGLVGWKRMDRRHPTRSGTVPARPDREQCREGGEVGRGRVGGDGHRVDRGARRLVRPGRWGVIL